VALRAVGSVVSFLVRLVKVFGASNKRRLHKIEVNGEARAANGIKRALDRQRIQTKSQPLLGYLFSNTFGVECEFFVQADFLTNF
jgi:hypothetical protein